jgi:hypothetical protein
VRIESRSLIRRHRQDLLFHCHLPCLLTLTFITRHNRMVFA